MSRLKHDKLCICINCCLKQADEVLNDSFCAETAVNEISDNEINESENIILIEDSDDDIDNDSKFKTTNWSNTLEIVAHIDLTEDDENLNFVSNDNLKSPSTSPKKQEENNIKLDANINKLENMFKILDVKNSLKRQRTNDDEVPKNEKPSKVQKNKEPLSILRTNIINKKKIFPKFKSNVLKNMTFFQSGILFGKYKMAVNKFVELHGGKMLNSYSKNINHIIIGIGPKPRTKIRAEFNKTSILSETQLIYLVLNKGETIQEKEITLQKENIEVLTKWLMNWKKKPLPQWTTSSKILNYNYKTVLLSGSSGIGKTRVAHSVAEKLCFKVFEYNALNKRNIKEIRYLVSREYRGIIDVDLCQKRLIIFDDLDMIDTDEESEVWELIEVMKVSTIPIICICNDRCLPSLKVLEKFCLNLNFNHVSIDELSRFLHEGINKTLPLTLPLLSKIVEENNCDIPYILNNLKFFWNNKNNNNNNSNNLEYYFVKKIKKLSFWEFTSQICVQDLKTNFLMLENGEFDHLEEDLRFDFVQQNCIRTENKFENVVKCLESLSTAELLNHEEFFFRDFHSIIVPGMFMHCNSVRFPQSKKTEFKKTSNSEKLNKLYSKDIFKLSNLSKTGLKMDYIQPIRDILLFSIDLNKDRIIPESLLSLINFYKLDFEDIESIFHLASSGSKNTTQKENSKILRFFRDKWPNKRTNKEIQEKITVFWRPQPKSPNFP